MYVCKVGCISETQQLEKFLLYFAATLYFGLLLIEQKVTKSLFVYNYK
jgi:hypothetical protein